MHSHLVSVEIGVKCGTYQRVQLDRLTLYKNRLKCLNTETVQCGGPVQHHRVLLNHILEHIPDLSLQALHHLFGALDIVCGPVCNQFFHYERLEQLNRHLFRKAALIYF